MEPLTDFLLDAARLVVDIREHPAALENGVITVAKLRVLQENLKQLLKEMDDCKLTSFLSLAD